MLVAAALVPDTALLVPGAGGVADPGSALREAALQAIADMAASTRLAAMVVGTNDLALELRARPEADRAGLIPYLALAVAAARAGGIAVLDGVCNDFSDLDRFAG